MRALGGPAIFVLIPNLLLPFLFATKSHGIRIPPLTFWEEYGQRLFSGAVLLGLSIFALICFKTPVYIATSARGIFVRNVFSRTLISWDDVLGCHVGWGYIRINLKNGRYMTSRVWLNSRDKTSFIKETQTQRRQCEDQLPE